MDRLAYQDEEHIHLQCLAYDNGHRAALEELLRVLVALAEKQVKRSAATVRRPLADDQEKYLASLDVQLWTFLSATLHQRDSGCSRPEALANAVLQRLSMLP
jgi:hypothetical protein